MLATLHDQLPGGNHTASMLFYTCSSNPTRSVLWVGLDQRVEEHPSALNVSNFRFCFQNHTVEIRQVAFWVDGCRSATNRRGSRNLCGHYEDQVQKANRRRYLVELERKDLVSRLADADEIRHTPGFSWSFIPTVLELQVRTYTRS